MTLQVRSLGPRFLTSQMSVINLQFVLRLGKSGGGDNVRAQERQALHCSTMMGPAFHSLDLESVAGHSAWFPHLQNRGHVITD